jgi:hypothetical protein
MEIRTQVFTLRAAHDPAEGSRQQWTGQVRHRVFRAAADRGAASASTLRTTSSTSAPSRMAAKSKQRRELANRHLAEGTPAGLRRRLSW